jgi:hypothetical protein
MMLLGFQPKLLILVVVVVACLAAAYFLIHWLKVPTDTGWVALYALLVWPATYVFDYAMDLHLEVLVPAFALGCIIKSDHLHGSAEYAATLPHPVGRTERDWGTILDLGIKGGFMLLAGMAMPRIALGDLGIGLVALHVALITVVSNIGKCVPLLAYSEEATIPERLALSIGMFPRGEVGIGVLLVSLDIFRQQNLLVSSAVQQSITVGALSLALNLCLTGLFIVAAIRLLGSHRGVKGRDAERVFTINAGLKKRTEP